MNIPKPYNKPFKTGRRTKSPNEARYKTDRWKKDRRPSFLAKHPHCINCGSRATHVDHKRNARNDDVNFWDEDNWQPMCSSCHTSKSNKERAKEKASKIRNTRK